MAQLAVALGGAALGGSIGIGANVGWIIGSIIGSLLFPPPGPPPIEGPRLGDLSVTSSAYGAIVPVIYGTIRTAGNMIWSTGLEEVKNTQKQGGGKGGGGASQTTITYEYFATFALGFAEGTADDVLRMWADGKLIYDKTGSNDDITKVDLRFRFYDGGETQEPDGLIEADKGVDSTPAFRGLCYIVFERLALKDFGNRIPSITVEITFNGSTSQPTTDLDFYTVAEGGLTNSFDTSTLLPDYIRGVFYFADNGGKILRRANTRTMKEDRQQAYTIDAFGNPVVGIQPHVVTPEGFILVGTTSQNTRALSLINPDSLDIVATFGVAGSGLSNDTNSFVALGNSRSSHIEVLGPNGLEYYALTGSVFDNLGLLNTTGGQLEYVWDNDSKPLLTPTFAASNARVNGTVGGAVGEGFGEGYIMGSSSFTAPSSANINLYKIVVEAGASYDPVSGL